MSAEFHKFPSTPHLAWLGKEPVRGDKVLTESERATFLAGEVSLEEKIDGANLGLSFSPRGELRFQNRGNWLEPPFRGQWRSLRDWSARHEPALRERLIPGLVLFGEWCYARHSVPYSRLPDWFLAFDVYDTEAGHFWSRMRRNELVLACGMCLIPELGTVVDSSLDHLKGYCEARSCCGDLPREGVYLRSDEGAWLKARAKLVNPGFVQEITEHWSRSGLTPNRLKESHS